MRTNLKNLSEDDLRRWIVELGAQPFRANQIFQWIHRHHATEVSEMTNISQAFRAQLQELVSIPRLELTSVLQSSDGTQKLLLRTDDGKMLETVLIPMPSGVTQCVSSQIGCHIGCPYCLTGKMPERRNLEVYEILDQVYLAASLLSDKEAAQRNLVFMGMGEPLHNYRNLVTSLHILLSQRGANFSSRRITVSTSGLLPKIAQLGEDVPVNLAISLNGATNATRDRMVPINRKYPIEQLIATLKAYPLAPRRRITIEYVMCKGVTDSLEDAQRLVRLLRELRVKINLIPFNPYPGAEFETPDDQQVTAFQAVLTQAGYQVNVRMHKGRDIGAACGQLDGREDATRPALILPQATLS